MSEAQKGLPFGLPPEFVKHAENLANGTDESPATTRPDTYPFGLSAAYVEDAMRMQDEPPAEAPVPHLTQGDQTQGGNHG